ncbi:MAG: 6-phosphogluconolactonase [Parvularculaceae bacterium]|nr:6-phosphogluconolactonase [Parvularculaceae bacterium]
MGSRAELIAFASRAFMAERVADLVELAILSASVTDGAGEVAVSGGSTPMAMYAALARRDLNWRRHRMTLVDERWVPLSHPRSNESAIRRAFAPAAGVRIDGLYNGAATPEAGLSDAEARIVRRQKDFDAVILGMGDDGHTASWFPRAEGLDAAISGDAPVAAIRAAKSAAAGDEVDRLTLTLSAIRGARVIILMIAGDGKRATFEDASGPGPVEDMPVRAILRARPDLWVCWAP